MSALRTFASLWLAALLGSGAALAQQQQQEPPHEPTNPHSTQNRDRPSPGAADQAQTEQWEKANPHSTRHQEREVPAGPADTERAERENPHSVRHAERSGSRFGADNGKVTAQSVLERLDVADQGEVKMGQLAQQNGGARVQEYGRMLEQDHQRGLKQVKDLARQKSLTLSETPKDGMAKEQLKESKEIHEKLAKLHGADFDKQFADAMVEDHQKDIDHLKSWRTSLASDKDLTALIDQTLPVLERHLQAAQQLKHPAAQGRRP